MFGTGGGTLRGEVTNHLGRRVWEHASRENFHLLIPHFSLSDTWFLLTRFTLFTSTVLKTIGEPSPPLPLHYLGYSPANYRVCFATVQLTYCPAFTSKPRWNQSCVTDIPPAMFSPNDFQSKLVRAWKLFNQFFCIFSKQFHSTLPFQLTLWRYQLSPTCMIGLCLRNSQPSTIMFPQLVKLAWLNAGFYDSTVEKL